MANKKITTLRIIKYVSWFIVAIIYILSIVHNLINMELFYIFNIINHFMSILYFLTAIMAWAIFTNIKNKEIRSHSFVFTWAPLFAALSHQFYIGAFKYESFKALNSIANICIIITAILFMKKISKNRRG